MPDQLKKPFRQRIKARAAKPATFDLENIIHDMARASLATTMRIGEEDVPFDKLLGAALRPEPYTDILHKRDQLCDELIASSHPQIDGQKRVKNIKSALTLLMKEHPLNPGEDETEKSRIARGFVDRMERAMIAAMPPELSATLQPKHSPE